MPTGLGVRYRSSGRSKWKSRLKASAAIRNRGTRRREVAINIGLAALFGGLPLAMGEGRDRSSAIPRGISIVGGLLLSQLLTLYTTPVVYIWFDRLASCVRGVRAAHGPLEAPQPGDWSGRRSIRSMARRGAKAEKKSKR